MAVKPPVMDLAILPTAEESKHVEYDDGSAASAVYALVRDEQGPQYYASNQEFIDKMNVFLGKNPDLKLIQVQGEEIVFSMLVNDEGQVYLVFDKDSGALVSADPGRWDKNGYGEWIDAGLKDGESLSLVPGEDGHAYIVKIDADGNIIAYLNTHEATTDNINEQWIDVVDGMPMKVWDGSKWVENGPVQYDIDLSHSPESIDDVAGKVNVETLQEDLKNLNQQILAAAEKQGIDPATLPLVQASLRVQSVDLRSKLPTQETVLVEIISQPNMDRQWVLTRLVDKNGEPMGVVASLLVVKDKKWGTESSEMAVINIVFDKQLLSKIDATGVTISREDSDLTKLADVLLREAGAPQEKINSVRFRVLNGPIKEGDSMMDNYDNEGRMNIPTHQQDWSDTLEILSLAAEGEYLIAVDLLLK